MLNGQAVGKSYPGESDGITRDMHQLCSHLRSRTLLVQGGTTNLWQYPTGPGALVTTCTMIARSVGIPVIDGEDDLRTFARGVDGEHMV
jgi:hypothetical protein